MKHNVKTRFLSIFAAAALAIGLVAPSTHAQSGYSVTLQNLSDYDVPHIYLSPVGIQSWGDDELGSQVVLACGYQFTLIDRFLPGRYDLKLVDEDGDVCVVPSVTVSGNTVWNITNEWLLACEFHNAR